MTEVSSMNDPDEAEYEQDTPGLTRYDTFDLDLDLKDNISLSFPILLYTHDRSIVIEYKE